ncbi:MAG: hypothetical protein RIQ93_2749, partial [Verrucomicrobiota bacterium]
MIPRNLFLLASASLVLLALGWGACPLGAAEAAAGSPFPPPLESYAAADSSGLLGTLQARIRAEPFNLAATLIFVLAIIHTFLTAKFRHWAHIAEEKHAARLAATEREPVTDENEDDLPDEVSFKGQVLHFLGEVEAVFGIWVIVLAAAITYYHNWGTVLDYVGHRVNFTEAMFVVVIMAIAATRPVLRFAEYCLRAVAALGNGSTGAWWLSLLIVAPVLGSFITEPAAMTIAALLLARQFYSLKPSLRFQYATLGLLFVNVSVGGTFTHFAAPPVLMVASPWRWDTAYMFTHFGWKALVGITSATLIYYAVFRRELAALNTARLAAEQAAGKSKTGNVPVPAWITTVQLAFMGFTVLVAHYPPLFIGGFLFFLAFTQ